MNPGNRDFIAAKNGVFDQATIMQDGSRSLCFQLIVDNKAPVTRLRPSDTSARCLTIASMGEEFAGTLTMQDNQPACTLETFPTVGGKALVPSNTQTVASTSGSSPTEGARRLCVCSSLAACSHHRALSRGKGERTDLGERRAD